MGSAAARLRRLAPGAVLAPFALLLALVLAGCTTDIGPAALTPPPPAPDGPPLKVAILVPLSSQGQPGLIAKSLKQAAELALFERDIPNLQLLVKDDLGTPDGAKAAAEDVLKRGATLILGPLFAKSVAAVGPLARKAGVPVVAFSNDRQVAGNGVYLLSFQPGPEVQRIVAYAAGRGRRRFAALIPQDNFGKAVVAAFRDAVARAGGSVAAVETYPASANGLLDPLRKIGAAIAAAETEATPIDALFIPGGPEYLENIARLLPHAKIDPGKVKLLGTGGMDYPNAGRDKSLVGAWYPGPDPRGWSDFAQKYAKTYGQGPPRLAVAAYDAVTLAIALAGEGTYSSASLTRAAGFAGIDGPYRLLADGTMERSLAILEVQKFGSAIVEAAPSAPGPPAVSGTSLSVFKAFQ
jgi:ABC-type branched-subunit amino acid transport system substrate-binding protein